MRLYIEKKKTKQSGEGKKADRIWKGGMGIMLLLLMLFLMAAVWLSMEFFSGGMTRGVLKMAIVILLYGICNLGVLCGVYFAVAKNVNDSLGKLSDLAEGLIDGKEREIFPTQEETMLSKLQGQLLKLYGILRSYEEKEQKMRRQLDENIGNLIHQMNTPITNIGLYTDFLKREDLTQEERGRFTGYIEEQAKKLGWLGDGFSKISRMETGIIRQKPEGQDILPVILKAVNQVMEKAGQKEMDIELTGERYAMAMVDAKWAAEAIFNVLDNGVKYGDRGSCVEIEVTLLTEYVEVAVRNYGIKIDKGEYHRIFKRFYRGKEARKKEGVGLGLTIAREVLEGGRGYMKAETLLDGRTEFALYFPKKIVKN